MNEEKLKWILWKYYPPLTEGQIYEIIASVKEAEAEEAKAKKKYS